MPVISTELCGLSLESPFVLASGILDENGYTMKRILEEGAAAVVTKSIGSIERSGYYPPVVAEIANGMLNAIGLSNPGIDNYGEEMRIATGVGKPVIGSIFGSSSGEFAALASKMEKYGASAIELNLSCPHVKGVGHEVGSDPVAVKEIVGAVKSAVRIPVFAKLSPNVSDIMEAATAAGEADGYTLINTVRGMKIDINARAPVLSNIYGGLSGPSVKPVGIRYVYEVSKETGKPIMGVGGISTFEDAVEYIMAGASAVQIGTALSSQGRGIFNRMKGEITAFMEREGFNSIQEMSGVAIRR